MTPSSDLWSAAYREAIDSLGEDLDVAILMGSNAAQLFKELEEIDKDATQDSAFLRGVAYLHSIQVPLERFKLALDLASPLSRLDPTATTVFGVVRSVTAIAISFATADLQFAKQIGEMLEQISYIDDCDTLGQRANRADIHKDTDPDTYYAAYDAAKEQLLLSLIAKISISALVSAASKIRDGLKCKVPALERNSKGQFNLDLIQSQMGGQNCHVDIEFEDGTVWLSRIRLDDPLLPPNPTQTYVFMSEIATLKFLEKTGVSAPKVYTYAAASSVNSVGASYMLMEKLPGVPLQWDEATSEQRTKVMGQLVEIFLKLEKRPLPTSGSLSRGHDVPKVSGFAQPNLFSSPEQTLGPFTTLESSLRAIILQQQDQIINGELSSLAVDNYLSHCWRRDRISDVTKYCDDCGPGFFIKHFDDKGDHILVDADFNITGLIDWEFASAEPKALAFSTPCMLWPVGDFYRGKNELSAEEIEFAEIFEAYGRDDMGKIVRESRRMQRFTFFNGGGVSRDYEEFQSLFAGLKAAWTGPDDRPTSYEDWKNEAKERYKDDGGLQSILRRRSTRFRS